MVSFSSVAQSHSTLCDPRQHTRPPCPSPTPGVYSNSWPLSRWCHPTISSSFVSFSSCLQSFPHQDLFQWVSSLHQVAKVLELQLQHPSSQWILMTGFLYNWLVWSLCCWRDSQESSSTLQFKSVNSSALGFLYGPALTSIHDYGKTRALTRRTSVGKVISLLFNILSRSVIAFLPRSKCLLISWLWSLSAVILEPKKIKSVTVLIISPSICHEVIGPDAINFVFGMLNFKLLHSPLSLSSRGSLVTLCFLPLGWFHLYIWSCLYFSCQS